METNVMDLESDESGSSNDEEWDDQDVDEPVQCLFCESCIPSMESAISHCKLVHDFDFENVMKRFNMDCYSFIKLVNFIRVTGASPQEIKQSKSPSWNEDIYLKPALEYDPWLMFGEFSADLR